MTLKLFLLPNPTEGWLLLLPTKGAPPKGAGLLKKEEKEDDPTPTTEGGGGRGAPLGGPRRWLRLRIMECNI